MENRFTFRLLLDGENKRVSVLQISTNVILTAVDATTCVPTQMGLISAVVARDIFSIAMVKPVEVCFRAFLLFVEYLD